MIGLKVMKKPLKKQLKAMLTCGIFSIAWHRKAVHMHVNLRTRYKDWAVSRLQEQPHPAKYIAPGWTLNQVSAVQKENRFWKNVSLGKTLLKKPMKKLWLL